MKKILLQSIALGCMSVPAMAQLEVSTTPANKVAVLEEYTGIKCTFCPDGHKRANEFKASKPKGSVLLINIHTGGYAAGTPDYRTADGDAISKIPGTGITGYPQGSINRHDFGSGSTATSRGDWAANGSLILTQPSPVNVAISGTINATTRELEVEVKAYYTADETVPNKLTVMLLEDSLISTQTGSSYYPAMQTPDGKYIHLHMLRDVITTAATGEVVTPTTMGTTISKTYKATIPANYKGVTANIANMSVVAIIAQGDKEILSGAEAHVTITGGLSVTQNTQIIPVLNVYPNPATTQIAAVFALQQDAVIGWKVIDMSGRVALSSAATKYASGNHTINISTDQMANGIYQLLITGENGVVRTERFSVAK